MEQAQSKEVRSEEITVDASFDGMGSVVDAPNEVLDISPDTTDDTPKPTAEGETPTAEKDKPDVPVVEPAAAEPEGKTTPDAPVKKKTAAERIPELLHDRDAEKTRADKAEAKVKELEKGTAPEPPDPAAEQIKKEEPETVPLTKEEIRTQAIEMAGDQPVEADFATFDEFNDANTDWKVDVRIYEGKIADNDQKKIDGINQAEQRFADKLHEGDAKWADFPELMQAPTTGFTHAMVAAMQDCTMIPEVAYYLAKNPQEMARIARMQPINIAREIGIIEAGFISDPGSIPKGPPPVPAGTEVATPPEPEAEVTTDKGTDSTTKPKTVSAAPAPIEPEGHAGELSKKNPDDMDHAEYRKWRETGGGR